MEKENILVLEERRVFVIQEEFTTTFSTRLCTNILCAIANNSKKDIYLLFINCPGGDIHAALQFYDFLKSLPCVSIGIVNGKCQSATTVLLAGCTKRLSFRHSRFFFHRMSTRFNLNDLHDTEKAIELLQKQRVQVLEDMFVIYKNEFGISKETYTELALRGETYGYELFASDMLALNVVHEIIVTLPFEF